MPEKKLRGHGVVMITLVVTHVITANVHYSGSNDGKSGYIICEKLTRFAVASKYT